MANVCVSVCMPVYALSQVCKSVFVCVCVCTVLNVRLHARVHIFVQIISVCVYPVKPDTVLGQRFYMCVMVSAYVCVRVSV